MMNWLRSKLRKFLELPDTAEDAPEDPAAIEVKIRHNEEIILVPAIAVRTCGTSLVVQIGDGREELVQQYQAVDPSRFAELFRRLCDVEIVDANGNPFFED